MFQEGVQENSEKERKEKKKKKIEWIIPNLPPPPSHEPFMMAASGWIVVPTIPLGYLSASVKTLPP